MNLKDYVASIPDFPQEGILFRDITPLMADGEAFHYACEELIDYAKKVGAQVVAGPESRGFIFGMPLAYKACKPFIPVRKKGKLPRETYEQTYDLEYGTATIEIHKDSIKPGQKVVLVDDLIATGGTIEAAAKLIEKCGGEVVKIIFLMELEGLEGRKKLAKYNVESVVKYQGK